MIEPTVSIIVPVYNVEHYLERCISSIMRQSYQKYELILVDDGSTDASGALCDELALQDNRIRVIHKKNGGVSSARNTGIKEARGDYLLFCDSDDTVEPTWTEKLLVTAIQHPNSLVSCCMNHVNDCNSKVSCTIVEGGLYDKKQYYRLIAPGIAGGVYIKIYNKSIIVENNISFDEGVFYSEDVIFTLDYLNHVSSFFVISDKLYNYFHYEENIRKTLSTDVTYKQMIYIYNKRLPYIADEDKDSYNKDVFGNLWIRFNELLRRKDMKFGIRMKEAKSILNDSLFQSYISKHGKEMFGSRSLKMIEKSDAFSYYLLQKVAKLKRFIRREQIDE